MGRKKKDLNGVSLDLQRQKQNSTDKNHEEMVEQQKL